VSAAIRRHPLVTYYILAFAISVALALLLNVSLIFGLLALFGPTVAAVAVTRSTEGRAGLAALRSAATRWRVHPAWYLAAVGLPIVGYAVSHLVYVAAGNRPLSIPGAVQPISLVLFFLVIGEEVGWRGFLLARLLRDRSPLVATAIVAAAWAIWHSPLYLVPGMPSYGQPFLAFIAWVAPISVLLTWLWIRTRSVWLATIMHGTLNLGAALVFPLTDAGQLFTFSAIGMAVVAAGLVLSARRQWTTRPLAAPVPEPLAAVPAPT
jgi:membrane protease YdiL (CAAX protease family)